MTLRQAARRRSFRRTAHPREHYERLLTCTRCGALTGVFEAAWGARTEEDHRFLDPAVFVCGGCLEQAEAVRVADLLRVAA